MGNPAERPEVLAARRVLSQFFVCESEDKKNMQQLTQAGPALLARGRGGVGVAVLQSLPTRPLCLWSPRPLPGQAPARPFTPAPEPKQSDEIERSWHQCVSRWVSASERGTTGARPCLRA